ncbi:transposase [Rhizobium sp. P38BS-XIX]|uniref:transposase n=1 Tax=Rhizobium sp. P38BS-XIX TaxID=2726740 RepID=UPI001FEDB049|nr:transposase [Rhizobium sp. P38BS-XIX]
MTPFHRVHSRLPFGDGLERAISLRQNGAIINGILWRLRCEAPWRDVPPKHGSWNIIYHRFRRWSEAKVWETVVVTPAETMADSGQYSIDSTTVRAHVSAAEKGDSSTRSWPLAGRIHQ